MSKMGCQDPRSGSLLGVAKVGTALPLERATTGRRAVAAGMGLGNGDGKRARAPMQGLGYSHDGDYLASGGTLKGSARL
jgi:hypothetical protein